MKCQQCDKQAVFHITELETGEVRELHLCEDHARTYLNQSEAAEGDDEDKPSAGGLTGPLTVGQTADELALLDKKELEPLIANIHGATQHTGRKPERAAAEAATLPEGTEELTGVIGLRRSMQEAITCEDYEKARESRDAIRRIEDRWLGGTGRDAATPKADTPTNET